MATDAKGNNIGEVYGAPCTRKHTVAIYDRGGVNRLMPLIEVNNLQYNRVLKDKSQAFVVLSGDACSAQYNRLREIEPRRHEMVIYRGTDRVWEGPIVQALGTNTYFQVTANDILEYLDGTALSQNWPNVANETMVSRMRRIITAEMGNSYTVPSDTGPMTRTAWESVSPRANVLNWLSYGANQTTLTTSSTEAFQMTLGTHLKNEASSTSGVNYTTVGRRLIIWDGSLSQTRLLTDADFAGDVQVFKDGSAYYAYNHVTPTSSTDDGTTPIVGHAGNDQSYYGPWETISTAQTENTTTDDAKTLNQTALNTQARQGLYGLHKVPVIVLPDSSSTLYLNDTLTMADLVCGTTVPVMSTAGTLPVFENLRLSALEVQESPTGETITPTLEGLGNNAEYDGQVITGNGIS